MEMNAFVWAAAIATAGVILQRIILGVVAHWKSYKQYAEEINKVLSSEENKVKGRFE